ncbi:MAG TPA: sensor histidine kinase [Gemmatimonadaceae bacterium]|nr:sensor histidine kinase [Gemmatimonadaceae bacterium]
MPNLSSFIRQHSSRILTEWETFARALPLGESMSVVGLRDHARAMLDVIAADLETPQTAREQTEKSKGLAPAERRATLSAAAEHGYGRAASGFTVGQMVAEFRALRASVTRLWTAQQDGFGQAELDDLVRFNEAIDQAIAESLARYSKASDETRERFLAVLGHDLRNPLGAIATSAAFLLESSVLDAEQTTLVRAVESAERRMSRLVEDLLDLALSRLGDGMPITPAAMDLGDVVGEVADEIRASYPNARIETQRSGVLTGSWDRARLAQALTNLVANAVQHGDANAPICVAARGDEREAVISVHNGGPPIPAEKVSRLFAGIGRGVTGTRDRRHLGLGLFIVDKIVEGHHGTLDMESTAEAGTTFTIRIPKSAAERSG